jgi:hypothetical protein
MDRIETLECMRKADPFPYQEVRARLDDEAMKKAMERAIVAGSLSSQAMPAGDRIAESDTRGGSRRRRSRLALVASSALACLGAFAIFVLAGGSPTGKGHPAYAAAAVAVAEANPRLLITVPGWRVTRAYGFEVDNGELDFGDGRHRLELDWYPARFYRRYLHDRAAVSPPERWTLLGRTATTVHYEDGADYATMLAPQGDVFVELRGRLASREEYDAVLRSLRPVGVAAWLAAMPPSLVSAGAGSALVRRMLSELPLPPGFDRSSLPTRNFLSNRYQLGTKVSGAVACAWLERWLTATRAGEAEIADEAVAAMGDARHWPLLLRMAHEGGWHGDTLPPHGHGQAALIQGYADEIEHGRLDRSPAGYEVTAAGVSYAIGPAYSLALGCKAHYRRRGKP